MARGRRRRRGETSSLVVLIEQYADEIEADLHELYNVDLLDLWRYKVSVRKVLNLVQHLPTESHTATAIRNSMTPEQLDEAQKGGDPSRARWSDLSMLIACVKDELAYLRHQHLIANGAKNVEDPQPMIRPGVTPRQAKGISEKQAKYLDGLRAQHKRNQELAAAAAGVEAEKEGDTDAG